MSRDRSKRHTPPPPAPKPAAKPSLGAVIERYGVAIAIALVLIATVRIAATYTVFSHTSDEPAHIACGMEWLDRGSYRDEPQHPPLARVAAAIGPYLLGRRYTAHTGKDAIFVEGLDILYQGTAYDATLTAARIGVLPFFWLACFVVYAWARRDFGTTAAVAALFLFTFLPPVLAHAGLATTDMALTAFVGAAFLAGRIWAERPSYRTAALFGVAAAGAALSKFSSLPFLSAAAVVALAWYLHSALIPLRSLAKMARERVASLAVAAGVAALIVWSGYRFSVGNHLPAPELWAGIRQLMEHNSRGHLSYLLGKLSGSGFWHYYFVVLGVKTPIAFLLLAAAGTVFLVRSRKAQPAAVLPLAFSGAILAVALFSRINIGVRHILPVYIGFSIAAAVGVLRLMKERAARKWMPVAVAAALGWLVLTSLASHPDYLPYFNEIAGNHPEKILIDSDLDWGQDMKRLMQRLRQGNAKALAIGSTYWINTHDPGLPYVHRLNPRTPLVGWNAAGITAWKTRFELVERDLNATVWPDLVPPQEIVGKSIYLWYFPPSSGLPIQ